VCEFAAVKLWHPIRHTLAALSWLGLALGPMVTPAAAMAAPIEMTTAGAQSTSLDMPEGMPCCPDQPVSTDCAKDCPFVAVCSGMAFPITAAAATSSAPMTLLAVIVPSDDAKLGGLAQGPPSKPPKA